MNTSLVPKLPMGCEDFRTLIDKKLLFVDKTLLIKELIKVVYNEYFSYS